METLPQSPETGKGPEKSAELDEAAAERLEQLRQSAEKGTEDDPSKRVEAAREVINKQPEKQTEPAEKGEKAKGRSPINRLDKKLSYKHTMLSLQRQMKPVQRNFSKFIHQPAVEKVSDVAAATVLRPSVTLGATTTALVAGGAAYIAARYYGFSLSGSEFILTLLVGGIIGAVIELIIKLGRGFGGFFKH